MNTDVPLAVRLLDGATGTNLQAAGMPEGVCPEHWLLQNKEILIKLQRAYADAGCDAVYAPTFGANRAVLKKYGLEDETVSINTELVKLSKQAVDGRCLVGGCMSPTSLFLEPFGDATMDDLFAIYTEQAKALCAAGADFLIIETMMNLGEARAALLAAKELCKLPVFVTVTVDENGRTLGGSSALCCMAVLQSMGADAFGLNCSTGPDLMIPIISELARYAEIPIIAKPNAGLPQVVDGKTVFSLDPEGFAAYVKPLAQAGASIIGGCCGTTPEHMAAVRRALDCEDVKNVKAPEKETGLIIAATEKDAHFIDATIDISDPIEITEDLAEDILDAEDKGVGAIKITFDDPSKMETFTNNSFMLNLPLCIDATDSGLFERAAMLYHGRALFDHAGEVASEEIESIINRYGIIVL